MASIRRRNRWRLVVDHLNSQDTYPSQRQADNAVDAYHAQGLMGLRTQRQPGGNWEARIRCSGAPPLVKTFRLRADAETWVKEREGEIAKRQFVDYRQADRTTLAELLRRYEQERLSDRSKHDPDRVRIRCLSAHAIGGLRMSLLQPSDVAEYRNERCKAVKGATVKKELELIARVIGVARSEWSIHLAANPASGRLVRRPDVQPGDERDRRLATQHVVASAGQGNAAPHVEPPAIPRPRLADQARPEQGQRKQGQRKQGQHKQVRRKQVDDAFESDPQTAVLLAMPQSEQQALLRACRYPHWYTQRKREVTASTARLRSQRDCEAPAKARLRGGCRLWAIVSLAIETAMRRGEMVGLTWRDVHLAEGYLDLPASLTKNGKPRIVPLSPRATRILATQPRSSERVFATNANTVKLAFRRALQRAQCQDLRLHDLRHEATSRLFERTTLREIDIGYVTGHTDPRMLARYYNKRPEEFVDRFHKAFK